MSQHSDLSAFESQYQRVFEAAECRTQVELPDFLEVRQSSISDGKRRKSIPSDWLVRLLAKKRISPEWILFGRGAMHLIPADAEQGKPHVVHITKVRPPQECSAQELVNELVRRALQESDSGTQKKSLPGDYHGTGENMSVYKP